MLYNVRSNNDLTNMGKKDKSVRGDVCPSLVGGVTGKYSCCRCDI